MEYHVVWDIDIEADSPLEAANEAYRIMKDPDSIANIFRVKRSCDSEDSYDVVLTEG